MKTTQKHLLAKAGSCALALALAASPTLALASSFSDVPDDWYTSSVEWVNAHGLITGYADGRFGVGDSLTRAQLAEILCRNSVPTSQRPSAYPTNSTGMSDVEDGQWYTYAANWAVQNHVINGYDGGTRFAPNDPVTAEQFVTIIGNYANNDISSKVQPNSAYELSDSYEIDSYAISKVAWALDTGLVNGYPNGDGTRSFHPLENITRERAATILTNAFENDVLTEGGNTGDESRAPYVVEYGFQKTEDNHAYLAMTVRNPSSKFQASSAQVTISGRDSSGRIVFVDSTYLWLAPTDTQTFARQTGNGTDFSAIDVSVTVGENNYVLGDARLANNYTVSNASYVEPANEYSNGSFTGEVTMRRDPSSMDNSTSHWAIASVIFRDSAGRMIGGDYTYVQNLAVGVPTPFEIRAYDMPDNVASWEIVAARD